MDNSKIPFLETERLILEPISMKFCTANYVNWLNDIEVIKYLDSGGNYTYQTLFNYLATYIEKPVMFWAIILKETNSHIGNIKIDPLIERNRSGEYGILMGDKNQWGKGYAREASVAVINYCFEILGLRKIDLGVIKDNVTAVKLYESLGFELEGISRMHGYYDGKYCDSYRMALFNVKNTVVKEYFNKRK